MEAEALRPRVPLAVLLARPGRAAREVFVPFARPGRGARVPEAPGAAMEVVRVLAGTTRFSEAKGGAGGAAATSLAAAPPGLSSSAAGNVQNPAASG